MRTITVEQFREELRAQGVSPHLHFAFRCPICKTIQSAQSLVSAGAGRDFGEVEGFLGFSCVGRFTGRRRHQRTDLPGLGCDWTLGGLLRVHELEIIHEGERRPHFELATPEEAQMLQAAHLIARPDQAQAAADPYLQTR